MNQIAQRSEVRMPAASVASIEFVRSLAEKSKSLKQVPLKTHHMFHAGIYARTIVLKKDVLITSVLFRRSTLVTLFGDVSVFNDGVTRRLVGYHVIPGSAGRKPAFLAHAETAITMSFATNAKTVEEAEKEFTDEFDDLLSHGCENEVVITGE